MIPLKTSGRKERWDEKGGEFTARAAANRVEFGEPQSESSPARALALALGVLWDGGASCPLSPSGLLSRHLSLLLIPLMVFSYFTPGPVNSTFCSR